MIIAVNFRIKAIGKKKPEKKSISVFTMSVVQDHFPVALVANLLLLC